MKQNRQQTLALAKQMFNNFLFEQSFYGYSSKHPQLVELRRKLFCHLSLNQGYTNTIDFLLENGEMDCNINIDINARTIGLIDTLDSIFDVSQSINSDSDGGESQTGIKQYYNWVDNKLEQKKRQILNLMNSKLSFCSVLSFLDAIYFASGTSSSVIDNYNDNGIYDKQYLVSRLLFGQKARNSSCIEFWCVQQYYQHRNDEQFFQELRRRVHDDSLF